MSLNERQVEEAAERFMRAYYPHDDYLVKEEVLHIPEDEDEDDMDIDHEERERIKKEEEKPRFARYVVHGSFRFPFANLNILIL